MSEIEWQCYRSTSPERGAVPDIQDDGMRGTWNGPFGWAGAGNATTRSTGSSARYGACLSSKPCGCEETGGRCHDGDVGHAGE